MTKGCINWITCTSHAINAKGLENDGWLELDMRNEINRAGDSGSVREHNDSTGNYARVTNWLQQILLTCMAANGKK